MKDESHPAKGPCFDCGVVEPLWSINVQHAPRETSRGKMMPGAGSVALCKACLEKEEKRHAA